MTIVLQSIAKGKRNVEDIVANNIYTNRIAITPMRMSTILIHCLRLSFSPYMPHARRAVTASEPLPMAFAIAIGPMRRAKLKSPVPMSVGKEHAAMIQNVFHEIFCGTVPNAAQRMAQWKFPRNNY